MSTHDQCTRVYDIIVYLLLDIKHSIQYRTYVAATLCMTCCNLLRGCLFIHQHYYKYILLPSLSLHCVSYKIGMFSAAQKRAPNATVCYLSSKLRAQKNMVVYYLDAIDDENRERMVRMSLSLGRRQRQRNRRKCADVKKELSKRQ